MNAPKEKIALFRQFESEFSDFKLQWKLKLYTWDGLCALIGM